MRAIVMILFAVAPVRFAAAQPKDLDKPVPYAAKLIHEPKPIPDRVILTWSGNPATTQSVTWRTDTSVTEAVAQIAEATDGPAFDPISSKDAKPGDRVTTVAAVTTPLKTDLNVAHYHSVSFTGLKPATKYVYRVGDKARPNNSEWFQFRTASDKPAPVEFVYFGDAQNDLKRHWSRVVRGAYADMPKATFFLHAGDLVNKANSDADWGEWHTAAGWINGSIPSIATPGNHEYAAPPRTGAPPKGENPPKGDVSPKEANPLARPKSILSGHWRPSFALPENGPRGLEETCYYLDVQGVRVISLNSNTEVEGQTAWLEQVLKDNPNKWTVVTFHHPVYATASTRQKEEEGKAVRKFWRPVFDQFPPDIVLQGHDHSYGRSGLMSGDNTLDGVQAVNQKGTVYCVSVSGPKMYPLGKQPWMVSSAEKKQLYQLIRIDGDKLHYSSYTAAGKLHDEFELRKRKNDINELVERSALDEERATEQEKRNGGDPLLALGGVGALTVVAAGLRLLRGKAGAVEPPI